MMLSYSILGEINMKVKLDRKGKLTLYPEYEIEAYALTRWMDDLKFSEENKVVICIDAEGIDDPALQV